MVWLKSFAASELCINMEMGLSRTRQRSPNSEEVVIEGALISFFHFEQIVDYCLNHRSFLDQMTPIDVKLLIRPWPRRLIMSTFISLYLSIQASTSLHSDVSTERFSLGEYYRTGKDNWPVIGGNK